MTRVSPDVKTILELEAAWALAAASAASSSSVGGRIRSAFEITSSTYLVRLPLRAERRLFSLA